MMKHVLVNLPAAQIENNTLDAVGGAQQAEEKKIVLSELPDEVLRRIAVLLPPASNANLCCVNKALQSMVKPVFLLQKAAIRSFPAQLKTCNGAGLLDFLGTPSSQFVLSHISSLDLSGRALKNEHVICLLHILPKSMKSSLRCLNLSRNEIGDDGAAAIAGSPLLHTLEKLEVFSNAIGEGGAAALASSSFLAKLKELNLSLNNIGPVGAKALANSLSLEQLERLDLSANTIGDEGAKAFAESLGVQKLQALLLSYTNVSDVGAIAFADTQSLKNLVELDLSCNQIGDAGAIAFANTDGLEKLEQLDLPDTSINVEGLAALRNSRFSSSVQSYFETASETEEDGA